MEDFQHLKDLLKRQGQEKEGIQKLRSSYYQDTGQEMLAKAAPAEKVVQEVQPVNYFNLTVVERKNINTLFASNEASVGQKKNNESDNLQINFSLPKKGVNMKDILSNIEDALIKEALNLSKNNKNKASKILGMNRTTLIEKMKKKGIPLS